uniref:Glyoxalase domain containing 4 n=1 Tax=Macaca nemestrina TaxID=9545 RepID=A0A2K6DX25_MACNE
MAARRALHFVFKVGNRFQTARFYRDVLGMKAAATTPGSFFFFFVFLVETGFHHVSQDSS